MPLVVLGVGHLLSNRLDIEGNTFWFSPEVGLMEERRGRFTWRFQRAKEQDIGQQYGSGLSVFDRVSGLVQQGLDGLHNRIAFLRLQGIRVRL